MEKPEKKKKEGKKKAKVKIFTKNKKKQNPESATIEKLKQQYEHIDPAKINNFKDLPLSYKTIKGLNECKYYKPTDIQKSSIPLGLRGQDILGAAQTGSGKTIAFLIPILEKLYTERWTNLDGIGALVITPTRELAYQIFECLRRIGKYHDFSAGLIIGGKDLKFERRRMDQCNIIICTPGRLLQHMDENPLFDCVTMKILVLDEADRCLDMGFRKELDAIVANLPEARQTLLFSATQTKSVQDLARLSLKDPAYVSVDEMTTPKALQQSYVVCELHDKLSILWSFIRNHLKQKIIIFFSTCKQVKYFYEIFCKLRPGMSLLPLYGTLHQLRRMKIYEDFCRKQSAVLFATDLAARGLDFPEVHWVVQADCPEDVETYIHRVGRTARFHKGGESFLLLTPSELKMLELLEEKKIVMEKIEINPSKLQNPVRKMEAFLSKDPSLKDTAHRAVAHYAKAVFFMKLKEVFDVQKLDFEAYSQSLGLPMAPRIRFLDRMNWKEKFRKQKENEVQEELRKLETAENSDGSSDSGISKSEEDTITNKPKPSRKQAQPPQNSNFSISDSDDEDILQEKRRDHAIEAPENVEEIEMPMGRTKKTKVVTKAAVAKQLLKKNVVPNKKIMFDDEGGAVIQGTKEKKSELARGYENEDAGGIDIERSKLVLREEDKFDKQMFQEKVKAKHKEEKRKLKALKKQEEEAEKDEFGESSDDGGPDLSWMPDPDKIYGEKESDEESTFNPDLDNVKKVKEEKKSKKRKPLDNLATVLKKKKKRRIEQLSSDLNVGETEELALMLLKNKQ